MKSNAPGQLLGYALQFPRALYHLLRSSPNDVVCIEVLGDVATLSPNGQVVSEEDKSSTIGNPITNRSTDLWKTLFNWINAIINNELDVEKTQFVLYCNQSGRLGIVNEFCSANTQKEVENAIRNVKNELKDIAKGHDIWDYYDFVVNENKKILAKLISKFDLQIGNDAGYEDVIQEIQRIHVHENQIEFLLDKLNGWVQRTACEKIYNKEKAFITWEEFHAEFLVLFDQLRCRELIDFTMNYSYSEGDESIQNQICLRPIYLQQLEEINLSEKEIMTEIADYLRADVNRERWIADEIIDEDVASDFEEKLKRFWENQRNRIRITQNSLKDIEQGKLLLNDCKSRQEVIRDMVPPASTISGTYHSLADEATIGWHPNWENIFIRKEED